MNHEGDDVIFKDYFVPFTTVKAITFLIIIAFIAFGSMLFNNFVWDDKTYILYYTNLHKFDLSFIFGQNLFNTGTQYRPIPALYFSALHSMFQDTTFFYHVYQLIIHITNSILLYFIFLKFFNIKLSFFLSTVFLVHPLQVESVSFIAASGNPIFFLFGISSLFLSLKKLPSRRRWVGISLLLLLSLLTKETGILFFGIILLYRVLFLKTSHRIFLLSNAFVILLYSFIRITAIGLHINKEANPAPIAMLPFIERALSIPLIIFYYLKSFFYPLRLSTNQIWVVKNIDFNNFFLPLFIDIVIGLLVIILGVYVYKRTMLFKQYILFLLWLLVGLGFHIQFFPLDMTVADRWFYFPIVGLLGVIGVFISIISNYFSSHKHIKSISFISGSIIAALIVITIVRNSNWYDAITLYTHDKNIHNNYDMENNLGNEYLSLQQYDEALKHFKYSESLYTFPSNIYNLAITYEQKGDYVSAKKYYLKLINFKGHAPTPDDFIIIAYEKLGFIMMHTDKPEIASTFIKDALKKYPNSSSLWVDLAVTEYKMKHQKEALQAATKAKEISQNDTTILLYQKILHSEPLNISNNL